VSVLDRASGLVAGHEEKLRFLVVGGWNTVFSYGMLWVLDALLHARLHYTLILTINWVIGVTHNLFTFKLFVFRTRGNWLTEYLRSYVVYAGTFVLNLAIVAVIMELWRPRLVIAQLPAIAVVTIISYVGHKYFTYKTSEETLAETYEADGSSRS
jgi:putative flippase GtrA